MKLQRLRKREPRISKGYVNYNKRGDCRGKRLYILLFIKRYYHLLDIDFGYYNLKRFWIEIVFLGIGFSYEAYTDDGFRFRNDYRI